MRELKFRLWEQTRTYYTKFSLTNREPHTSMAALFNEFPDEDLLIEQWTGLTDKYGVDIYDGDVLEFTPSIEFMGSCIWSNWAHVWIDQTDGVRVSYNHPGSEMSDRWLDIISKYYENLENRSHGKRLEYKVIGTIHEQETLQRGRQ